MEALSAGDPLLFAAAGYRGKIPAVAHRLRFFGPVSLVGGLLGGILLVMTPGEGANYAPPSRQRIEARR